jgi:hypothetical protein
LKFFPAKWLGSILIAVLAWSTQAQADVVVSNLADSQDGDASITSLGWEAQEFVTGSQSVQLTSIVLPLSALPGQGGLTGTAELVADNSGLPGSSVVATFFAATVALSFPTFDLYTLTPDSSATLTANTDYWLVLGPGSGGFYWGGTHTDTASILNSANSQNSGTSWTAPTWYPEGAFQMQVNASPVPLPATAWLVLSGLGGLGMFARGRSRAG